MTTHIHFVIACVLFELLFIFFHRKSSSLKQILGLLLLPISTYFFIYEKTLLHTSNILQTYLTALICFSLTSFFCTLSFTNPSEKKTKTIHTILLFLLSILFTTLLYGIPYIINSFPSNNPEAVLFTLFQNNTGTENFIWSMLSENILYPSIKTITTLYIILLSLAFIIKASKHTWVFSFFSLKLRFPSCNSTIATLQKIQLISFFIILLLFLFSIPQLYRPIYDLYTAYSALNKKEHSSLYLNEYVFPDSATITFPTNKKNLIYIMMESMEVNFKEFTPEINTLANMNISFTPGGTDVAYTGWTIAAQVSKLCGIPLILPHGLENSNKIHSYLPNVKCLTDILNDNNYNQIYVQGSDGDFASKRNFWAQHGVTQFYDFPYYKKVGKIPNKRENPDWGMSDETLYQLIKEELNIITKDTLFPFALYALTVDTHFPQGFLSKSCKQDSLDSLQYPSVLRCASKQLHNFIEWAQKQNWFSNTTIVIVGDHTWSTFTDLLKFQKNEPLYWVNIFINSPSPNYKERKFSSFDMFPTVLESIGISITGHKLGLGTSLFSTERTLLEKKSKTTLDSMLRIKSYQYDYFMYGSSF